MKKHLFSFVVAVCVVATAGFAAETAPLTLARRGSPAEFTIITPAQASEAERYAAEELQTFLEKVAGVKLPIASDATALPAKAILVGSTAHTAGVLKDPAFDLKSLGDDGFRLVARPPHLVVLGSPRRGILYGVYELLETYAGCRWYTSWHSRIPVRDRVSVPAALDDTQKPAFAAGIYDAAQRHNAVVIAPSTDQTSADYAWYDLGTTVLNDHEYLWIAPGRFEAPAVSAVKAVYLDKVDFTLVTP